MAANTSNSTGPVPKTTFNPLITVLETFIPGFSLVSGLVSTYFNVDLTLYLWFLLLLFGFITAASYFKNIVFGYIQEYFISTAEIRFDDEIYNYLMFWVSKQGFSRRTSRFVAGTKTNSDYVYMSDDDSDDGGIGDDAELQLLGDMDNLQKKPMNLDKLKTIHYTPSDGTHFFRYNGKFLTFTRSQDDKQTYYGRAHIENLYISCLGRNPQVIKELLEEAQRSYWERDGVKTVIYRGSKPQGGGEGMEWIRCLSRPPRPLSTVVLGEDQKQAFIEDMREYLHPYTRRWYSNRGIPYRRGYLLHGPPGTGKTSLCFAAAGLLRLRIYVVSLNSKSLTEDNLAALFRDLPWRCIVLMEDIDSAGLSSDRGDTPAAVEPKPEPSTNGETSNRPPPPSEGPAPPVIQTPNTGISLSAFLNIIDGVASNEGRILVMTTNHLEKLDAAMLRPGRTDLIIGFGYADREMIIGLYKAIFTSFEAERPKPSIETNGAPSKPTSNPLASSNAKQKLSPASAAALTARMLSRFHGKSDEEIVTLAEKFADKMPMGEFTPAEIQGYLLRHKGSPDGAIEAVDEWAKKTREEKEKRRKL